MRAVATIWIVVFALLGCVPASACSWSDQQMSAAQVRDYARAQFATASVVVDAEVEWPMSPTPGRGLVQIAHLRVSKRIKGPADLKYVSVVATGSCDIQLLRKGERVRILLSDGPNLFTANMTMNGPLAYRESALPEFNAEIDRLAGGPRPSGFSNYPGELHAASDITYRDEPNIVSLGPVKALVPPPSNKLPILIGIGAGLLTFFALALVSRIRRSREGKG